MLPRFCIIRLCQVKVWFFGGLASIGFTKMKARVAASHLAAPHLNGVEVKGKELWDFWWQLNLITMRNEDCYSTVESRESVGLPGSWEPLRFLSVFMVSD